MRRAPSRLAAAALCAVAVSSGCVSVERHRQVVGQLAVEQRKAIERDSRRREIEFLAAKLRKRAELAEIERDEARAKLVSAKRLLAFRPPEGARPGAGGDGPPGAPAGRRAGKAALVGALSFAAGSDKLSDADTARIAAIARTLTRLPPGEIVIEGHSDPAPIDRTQSRFRSNMHISIVRALAVYHELVRQPGVDPQRVVVVGYGEHKPEAQGAGILRRVDIRYRRTPYDGNAGFHHGDTESTENGN